MKIPFNKPYLTGNEFQYFKEADSNGQFSGDGRFTKLCNEWLAASTSSCKVLLTHSCTAALEMAAILANIKPGDEIIMPSYTFVSTANAFMLRGGVPVFVDIRPDTLNIDEKLIESAITSKTRAIVPVHYAGVACEMDLIMDIAMRYDLLVIEDAAQAVNACYKGRALGSIGHLGCYSFHETKNIIAGEGGALLINDANLVNRAEIIWEKGTNRKQFFRGQVDKYTWVDVGSSFLPGEMTAAFLWAQIQEIQEITNRRLSVWDRYHEAFEGFEKAGRIRRPIIPSESLHNAHMYYLLLQNLEDRSSFIERMAKSDIGCVFHYVPLHSSPVGSVRGRSIGVLSNTSDTADRLVRLPLWVGLENFQNKVIQAAVTYLAGDEI